MSIRPRHTLILYSSIDLPIPTIEQFNDVSRSIEISAGQITTTNEFQCSNTVQQYNDLSTQIPIFSSQFPTAPALLLIFFTLSLLPPNSSQPCKTCQTQQKSTQKVLNPNQAVNNVNAKQKPTVLPSPTKNLVVPNRRIGKKPILLGWVKPLDQFHGKILTPLLTVYCLPCKIVHFSWFFFMSTGYLLILFKNDFGSFWIF